MGKLILLIDDDKLPMLYYVKALEEMDFKVKQCYDPDSAIEFAKSHGSNIAAILLDVMMPPGKAYRNVNTNEGLRTGVFLFDDLRKHCPRVPVVVLTNVRNPETLSSFKEGALLKIAQKTDWPPFELTELVQEMLK